MVYATVIPITWVHRHDRDFADKYRALGLPISLIGVEFSRESRNVVGFEVAQLG